MNDVRIAVVGLGPAGLTAMKSLLEEGFQAVGFERRERVGGLWSFSADTGHTSVLHETLSNISKFVSGFSDFPIPKGSPTYLNASQVANYLGTYAEHFGLENHCRFKTDVNKVVRDESDRGWNVHISGPSGADCIYFDKVVFCSGHNSIPKWPPMPGREGFKGTVLHAQSFRNPEQFEGKRVVVVGIGNTACDVSLTLVGHCTKVYQAYRRGRITISRYQDDGIPLDSTIPWTMSRLKYWLDYWVPWLTLSLVDMVMTKKMISDAARHVSGSSAAERLKTAEHKVKQIWRLKPFPSMARQNPAAQEDFIPALNSGAITPVRGFKGFKGENGVLLDDGSAIEVDAIIFCTGYAFDFSLFPEVEMDGACGLPRTTSEQLASQGEERIKEDQGTHPQHRNQPHLPRLYQTIFPPRHAKSIAFLSWMAPQENVWCVSELASIALGQIWAAETAQDLGLKQSQGNEQRRPALLPSIEEMDREVDDYHKWWRDNWTKDASMLSGFLRAHLFYRFLHDKAGTTLYEHMDHMFTTRGWWLWWNDPELYKWLSKGPMNSLAWRLWNTNPEGLPGCGRKAWPGARDAMKEAYDDYEDFKKDLDKKKR